MAEIIVLGAGIGGISMAYELRALIGRKANITLLSDLEWFHFVPSNPWVAVNWRKPEDIKVHLPNICKKLKIGFDATGAKHVLPGENAIELNDGRRLTYDYLVIATGPALAFDEIEGLGPEQNTVSICHVDHAKETAEKWERFCKNPGPIVIGAVQGASCFGPAYEFALIVNADLRKRKIRDRVPITFVTSEPYIGHLGLGGVGDTKGVLESAFRDRDIKWVTNAKLDRANAEFVDITEVGDDGQPKRQHSFPSKFTMFIPGFRGVSCMMGEDGKGLAGLANPRGFILVDGRRVLGPFGESCFREIFPAQGPQGLGGTHLRTPDYEGYRRQPLRPNRRPRPELRDRVSARHARVLGSHLSRSRAKERHHE